MGRRTFEVAPGQHYRKVGRGGGTWEVVGIRTDDLGAVHALLQSLEEPHTFRTFSVDMLGDAQTFEPISL
jgi:hypothetical protein